MSEAVVLACVLASALLIAFAIDHFLGEPPVRLHPVVWMGNYLNWAAVNVLPKPVADDNTSDYKSFLTGASVWITATALILIVTCSLQWVIFQIPFVLAILLLGLLLKPLFAWRMLCREVQAVDMALQESLEAGRARLAMLVSRDTSQLNESEVRESAIESLAENLNDSVVAPVFWFVLFGLPGAAVYRFANTADAMWGYPGLRHGVNWAWAGKWAARADDVLSWLPARITALLLWLVAGGFKLHTLGHEARKTPSPNSGWPMAAMALALGVRLRKPGVYALHEAGRSPQVQDIAMAQKYASKVVVALILCAQAAIILIAIVKLL